MLFGGEIGIKKSIFDLTFKEGKEVEKAMRKSSYYKQYLIQFLLSDFVIIVFACWIISHFSGSNLDDAFMNEAVQGIVFIIALGFIAIIELLFEFKRFDLVKMYYKEKNEDK